MSVATGTAIALGVGALSAGASVASAKMQSNAAKNAAKIQTASQDKAQTFNQQAYNDQRAAMAPYVQGGQDAFSRLMSQHYGTGGLSAGMRGTTMQPGQTFTPQAPQGPPQQGPFQQAMAPPQGQAPMPPQQGQMPPQAQGAQGQMVLMVGPDGTQKMIPQANVQAAIAKGAKVVQ